MFLLQNNNFIVFDHLVSKNYCIFRVNHLFKKKIKNCNTFYFVAMICVCKKLYSFRLLHLSETVH